jgi:hypothetical protein
VLNYISTQTDESQINVWKGLPVGSDQLQKNIKLHVNKNLAIL